MDKYMKIENLLKVSPVLKGIKGSMLDPDDLVTVVKIGRQLNAIQAEYEAIRTDVVTRMKDERFDEMLARLRGASSDQYTDEEVDEARAYIAEFNRKCADAMRDENEKEYSITVQTPMDDVSFGKLAKAADWDIDRMILVRELLCDD